MHTDLYGMASLRTSPGGQPGTPTDACRYSRTSFCDTSPGCTRSEDHYSIPQDNSESKRMTQDLHLPDKLNVELTLWVLHTRPPDPFDPMSHADVKTWTKSTFQVFNKMHPAPWKTILRKEFENVHPRNCDLPAHPFGTPRPPECGITICQDTTEN